MDLQGRSLLKEVDFTKDEFLYLVDLAEQLRDEKRSGTERQRMIGRNIALIFEKASTRTRSAFEVGAHDQGAHVTYLGPGGVAHRPQGDDQGHGPGARPDVRRHRIPRLRPGDRRDAGPYRRRAGLERADRPVASHPDAGRRAHHARPRATSRSTRSPTATWAMPGTTRRNSLLVTGALLGHGCPHRRLRRRCWPIAGSPSHRRASSAADSGARITRQRRRRRRRSRGPTSSTPTSGSRWASLSSEWGEAHRPAAALPGQLPS